MTNTPEPHSLIHKTLCFWGFHKMPKWSAPKIGSKSSHLDPIPLPASIQERTCERCGAIKLRFAR